MRHLGESLEELVKSLGSVGGGVGLFVIAFFDSSLLSLPEVNDLLLIYFSTQFEDKAYYYAVMTAAGSATGASLLYWLARWKGYAFLRRKFPEGRLDTVFSLFRRYGALTIAVPAVLPPPFPFKIFVLSSGVLGLPYARFLAAIVAGRCVRYMGEAYLAVRYGERAITYLRANAATVLYAVLGLAVLGLVILLLLGLRRRHLSRKASRGLEIQAAEE